MVKYAELLQQQKPEESSQQDVELLPNRFAELEVDRPVFLNDAVYVEAADENVDLLYEKKYPKKLEDIIEKAHPKPVYVSNALGDGGLVENQNEQQEKIQQMINKRPRGEHIHVAADLVQNLTKIANELDDIGHDKFAAEIDDVLADLTGETKKKLNKTAFPSILAWGLGALFSGILGGTTYTALYGIPENLVEDAEDALDVAEELPGAFPHSQQYTRNVYQSVQQLHRLSIELMRLTQPRSADRNNVNRADRVLKEIQTHYANALRNLAVLEGRESSLPVVGYLSRLEGHLNSFETSFNSFIKGLGAAGQEVQRQRAALPGQEEVGRIRQQKQEHTHAPIREEPKTLNQQEKAKVMALLEKIKPGVIEADLDERLDDFAQRIVKAIEARTGIVVDNLTGDRLKHANVNQLRRLLNLARQPLITIQYVPGEQ